jgi:hypothetical protein
MARHLASGQGIAPLTVIFGGTRQAGLELDQHLDRLATGGRESQLKLMWSSTPSAALGSPHALIDVFGDSPDAREARPCAVQPRFIRAK